VILTAWRLVPAAQAASAFDGEGARLYGGRWNSVGVSLVYASQHLSLAALEIRVHIEKTSMAMPYKCFALHFDESLLDRFPKEKLPKTWREQPAPAAVQALGDAWVKKGESAILAVPSSIIEHESNLLINPRHPAFSRIRVDKPTDFWFDQRLFR
jgi:RES domain-containing protein